MSRMREHRAVCGSRAPAVRYVGLLRWAAAGGLALGCSCQSINDASEFVIVGLPPDAGAPPQAVDECEAGDVMSCGPGPCLGQRVCELSENHVAVWGPCEPPLLGPFQTPEPVTGLELDVAAWGPALADAGGTLLFAAGTPEDIFRASRSGRGALFSAAAPLAAINTPGEEGTPFASADGLALYFYAIRQGGVGGRDLWVAERAAPGAELGAPTPLPVVNTSADEQNPWLSPDGRTLLFDSTRPGGQGQQDLWIARRPARGADFGEPENLAALNGPDYDQGPALSADGLSLFFASTRPGGQGDLDLWVASRGSLDAEFSEPENLEAVNSTGLDLDPALSADGAELFFSSSRDGAQRLYRAVRRCD